MGQNKELMQLTWDFFGANDIYMRLESEEERSSQEIEAKGEENE